MKTSEVTAAALFLALAIGSAMLSRFGGSIVPFSLLPFVCVLAGAILGPRLGALCFTSYMLMGLVGIPVFATAPFGGPAYVIKPTFGFIPGFILGAFVSGAVSGGLSRTKVPKGIPGIIGSILGITAIYAVGLPYLWFSLNIISGKAVSVPAVLRMALIPFVVPDLIKALIAGTLAGNILPRLKNMGTR